jgi:hypothetical protein
MEGQVDEAPQLQENTMKIAQHWLLRSDFTKTFCGRRYSETPLTTTKKEKVTCLRCLALMRLHGHIGNE